MPAASAWLIWCQLSSASPIGPELELGPASGAQEMGIGPAEDLLRCQGGKIQVISPAALIRQQARK